LQRIQYNYTLTVPHISLQEETNQLSNHGPPSIVIIISYSMNKGEVTSYQQDQTAVKPLIEFGTFA